MQSQRIERMTSATKEGISWPSETTKIAFPKQRMGIGSADTEMGLVGHKGIMGTGTGNRDDVVKSPLDQEPYHTVARWE